MSNKLSIARAEVILPLFTAALGLAITFTLSCSSDDGNNNGGGGSSSSGGGTSGTYCVIHEWKQCFKEGVNDECSTFGEVFSVATIIMDNCPANYELLEETK